MPPYDRTHPPWGVAWARLWDEVGLLQGAAVHLLPATGLPRAGAKPANSVHVTAFLRAALVQCGLETREAETYTSHSLKSTTLSKKRISKGERKRISSNDKSLPLPLFGRPRMGVETLLNNN